MTGVTASAVQPSPTTALARVWAVLVCACALGANGANGVVASAAAAAAAALSQRPKERVGKEGRKSGRTKWRELEIRGREGGRKRGTQRHTDRKTQAGKKFSPSLFLI